MNNVAFSVSDVHPMQNAYIFVFREGKVIAHRVDLTSPLAGFNISGMF